MSDYNKEHFLEPYDQDYGLLEIFKSAGLSSLNKLFSGLLGDDYYISDINDNVVLGSKCDFKNQLDIDIEFEKAGALFYNRDISEGAVSSIKNTIQIVSSAYQKYIMASSLHIEAVHADYAEIKLKKEQLEESEAKYRELSEQLDVRVKEQVIEIENKQRQLYLAERYSAIGRLSAGVAHEINNPMGFILSNLNTSKTYLDNLSALIKMILDNASYDDVKNYIKSNEVEYDLEDFYDLIDESVTGGTRIRSIVSALMIFSDVDIESSEDVSIVDISNNVLESYKLPDDKKINICINANQEALIKCNQTLLMQVFRNVLSNAISSIETEGVICFEESLDHEGVCIMISDTGCGMSEEVLSKVFDPFFTTRDVGQGVGLGMTVANEVINTMGGTIEIQSELEKGTKVIIHLPEIKSSSDAKLDG